MTVVRAVAGGFVLMAVNFIGIGAGFMAYRAIGRAAQRKVDI